MAIDPNDFEFISQLVRADSAIVLEKGKEYLVDARLQPLAKKGGFADLSSFVESLRKNPRGESRRLVVEALTTNETSFYRDIEPFEALKTTLIPEIIKKRADQKKIKIWCAASSSGQEPFSICMLIRENFPELNSWKIEVLATDISEEILERARSGKFSQFEVNRGLPIAYLVKYFTKCGSDWQLKEDILKMITFKQFNLLQPFSMISDVDIVFMRNVLIYFDLDTKRAILQKTKKTLCPNGILFLGAAETTLNLDEGFERRSIGKASCYALKS